jgi:AcrR family transcriptional regulator
MNMQSESQRSSDEVIDGRTARRDRGRNAVLEAALELWEEENLEPSPEQIAQRAGVSTRSVYRYFEDRDQLVRAIIAHKQMQIVPLFRIEDMGQGDLELRILRFVDSRLEVYEAIGASARAMTIKASGDPVIAEQIAFRKSEFRQQVVRQFDSELARMTDTERMVSLNSVDALTQAESLDRFRRELQLSKDDCRTLLVASIRALLTTRA